MSWAPDEQELKDWLFWFFEKLSLISFAMLVACIASGVMFAAVWALAALLLAAGCGSPIVHDAALPVIAVAFACAAFPLQAASIHNEFKGRLLSLISFAMFAGAFLLSMGYMGYWGITTGCQVDPERNFVRSLIEVCIFFVSCALACGGAFIWFMASIAYFAFYLQVVVAWRKALEATEQMEREAQEREAYEKRRERALAAFASLFGEPKVEQPPR